jgi:hypothetical protein
LSPSGNRARTSNRRHVKRRGKDSGLGCDEREFVRASSARVSIGLDHRSRARLRLQAIEKVAREFGQSLASFSTTATEVIEEPRRREFRTWRQAPLMDSGSASGFRIVVPIGGNGIASDKVSALVDQLHPRGARIRLGFCVMIVETPPLLPASIIRGSYFGRLVGLFCCAFGGTSGADFTLSGAGFTGSLKSSCGRT